MSSLASRSLRNLVRFSRLAGRITTQQTNRYTILTFLIGLSLYGRISGFAAPLYKVWSFLGPIPSIGALFDRIVRRRARPARAVRCRVGRWP